MRGGTLTAMWGGTLTEMRGGTLTAMWGGTLTEMRDGTLTAMRDGTLTAMCGGTALFFSKFSCKIKNTATVLIDRTSSKARCFVGSEKMRTVKSK